MDSTTVGVTADPHVFLAGRPPMGEYLGFVTATVGGDELNIGALAESWRQANRHVEELRLAEADYANNPMIGELPEHLRPLGERVIADPIVQRSFAVVPVSIGVVELDRLVVFQKHIDLAHIARLRAVLGDDPSDEDVFNLCLPIDRGLDAPTRAGAVGPNAWAFASGSSDFRVLGTKLIDPASLDGVLNGAPTHVVATVIGFGSNMLSAIHAEDRLVLANGSHRAYALRDAGITHVPCLIQQVTLRDELAVITGGEVAVNPDVYLTAPRPPVLRDYFDDKLRVVLHVAPKDRQVQVQVSFGQMDVPTG